MIRLGADISQRNMYGNYPLHLAATYNSNPEVLRLLWKDPAYGVPHIGSRSYAGWSPLHCAAWSNPNPEVTKVLIENGSYLIRSQDDDGYTPLLRAALNNTSHEVIELLIDAGSDMTAENKSGETVIDLLKKNEELKNTDSYWKANDRIYR